MTQTTNNVQLWKIHIKDKLLVIKDNPNIIEIAENIESKYMINNECRQFAHFLKCRFITVYDNQNLKFIHQFIPSHIHQMPKLE